MTDSILAIALLGGIFLFAQDFERKADRRHRALMGKLEDIIKVSESNQRAIREIVRGNDELREIDAETRAAAIIGLMAKKLGVVE